jgi:hypothetical protein
MGRNVNSELWSAWRARLTRQSTSQLTIAEFCRREQVSVNGFYSWKRRLQTGAQRRASRANGSDIADRSRSRMGRKLLSATTGRFLEVPLAVPRTDAAIEVVLVDGTLVRVPQGNLPALELVLATLTATRTTRATGDQRHA